MAQLLQVIKDPSIVKNVPVTPLETLQNALDKVAPTYQMTRHKAADDPIVAAILAAAANQPGEAQMRAMRNINGAYLDPITHTAIATQDRLQPQPNGMAFAYGDGIPARGTSATAAITKATQPWGPGPTPRPFAAPLIGEMPKPHGVAIPDTQGAFNIPMSAGAPQSAPAAQSGPIRSAQAAPGTPVTLASGTKSVVGATGTAQGGAFNYVVLPDGSIGRSQPAVLPPAAAAQRAADMASVTQSKGFPGSGIY